MLVHDRIRSLVVDCSNNFRHICMAPTPPSITSASPVIIQCIATLLLLLASQWCPLPITQQTPQAAKLKFIRANSGWRYFPQRFDLLLVAGVILAGAWGV